MTTTRAPNATAVHHGRAQSHGTASLETVVIICGVLCVVFGIANVIANMTERSFAAVHSQPNLASPSHPDTPAQSTVIEATSPSASFYFSIALLVTLIACPAGLFLIFIKRQLSRLENAIEITPEEREPSPPKTRSASLSNVLSKRNAILARLEGSWEVIMEGHAVVSTYMSRDLFSVAPDTTPQAALEQLNAKGFRRCMVTDQEGNLLGVVSKKDVLSKSGKHVQDVMTDRPRLASPDMEIHIALSVLLENRISCLPVVEDGRLVGIISTSDLLMVLQCLLLELSIIGKKSREKAADTKTTSFIGAPVHLAKAFPTGEHFIG